MHLITDPIISYDRDKILSELHLERYKNNEELLDDLINDCSTLTNSRIGYDTVTVEEVLPGSLLLENGETLNCSTLAEKGCYEFGVIPYIITIGDKLEKKVTDLASTSMLYSYSLDRLGNYVLRQTRRYFENFILREKRFTVSSFTPGDMASWKIEELATIFRLLGAADIEKEMGVTLTESFLMIPQKSTCGVMAQTSETFVKCQECTMKCEYRLIHYQESKEQR